MKILAALRDESLVEAVTGALARNAQPVEIIRVDDGREASRLLGLWRYDCAIVDAAVLEADNSSFLAEADVADLRTPVVLIADNDKIQALANSGLRAFDILDRQCLCDGRLERSVRNAVRVGEAEQRANLAEQALAHIAMHDALTGLPNRALFDDRLSNAVALAEREGRSLALLLIDLHRFGEINQTFGHYIGDLVLDEVAGRFQRTLRSADTLARLAGDEFAVLLSTSVSLTGAVNTANKILAALKEPVVIQDHKLSVGAHIGIALYPVHCSDRQSLVRHANAAMAEARHSRSGLAIYAGGDLEDNVVEMSLASEIYPALDKGEFLLHYQPVVGLSDRSVVSLEALLRWRHPRHGMISPGVFIPLAERTGKMNEITRWVLDSVLEQSKIWEAWNIQVPISVNVSADTLHDTAFPDQVAELIAKWDVPVERLKLEITESAIISDVARATETVTRLDRMGVRISIDDFGTGYTSIAYLRRLPLAEIKIDKSYVLNMMTDSGDAFIVSTFIDLGHNLGLKVVAEGVEDEKTWALLADLRCDVAQGFYISPPVDRVAIEAWLKQSHWKPAAETASPTPTARAGAPAS